MRYPLLLLLSALILGVVGNASDVPFITQLAGAAFVVALIWWMVSSRWFKRMAPPLKPMPNLFPKLGKKAWCAVCGNAVAPAKACSECQSPMRTSKAK